jgi:uncharacterized membrane protein YbhN (UPF0104 family)
MSRLLCLRGVVPLAVLAAVALAFYLAAGRFLDLARTLESLERLDGLQAGGALGCAFLLYGLKALRWRWYVAAAGQSLAWRTALAVYLAGQWFTLARSADLSRVLIAWRIGVPYDLAIAVGVVAGVADFGAIAWTGFAACLWHPEYALLLGPAAVGAAVLVWALGGAGPLGRLVEAELPRKFAGAVQSGRRLLRGSALGVGLGISVLDALAGAGVLLFAALAVGLDTVALPRALLVYALAQIAAGLSMVPLGLGVLEGSGVLLLVAGGFDASQAAAALVLYRLATLSASMLLGGGALLALRCGLCPAAPR